MAQRTTYVMFMMTNLIEPRMGKLILIENNWPDFHNDLLDSLKDLGDFSVWIIFQTDFRK